MYHHLYSYLEELKILCLLQFGSREMFDCRLSMLLFLSLDLFTSPLTIMNLVVVYFIDLKIAFDTVNHTTLLTKLKHYFK